MAVESHREYCDPLQGSDFRHGLPPSITSGGNLANPQLATEQGQSQPKGPHPKPEVHLVHVVQRPSHKLGAVTEVQAGNVSRMLFLQRGGWIPPLPNLLSGPGPRNFPRGLSHPHLFHRRPIFLVQSEISRSKLSLPSGQACWPGPDRRGCQPHPHQQETVASCLLVQALGNHQVLCWGNSQTLPWVGNIPDHLVKQAKSQVHVSGLPGHLSNRQPGWGPISWGPPLAFIQPLSVNAWQPILVGNELVKPPDYLSFLFSHLCCKPSWCLKATTFYGISSDTQAKIYDRKKSLLL